MRSIAEMDTMSVLRSFKNLLAETEKKISQIHNKEYSGDVTEDLLLKDYANYFESTISILKVQPLLIYNDSVVTSEFKKLLEINVLKAISKKPFNIFTMFNDYLEGGENYQGRFNLKILKILEGIAANCKNLIYFFSVNL